MDEYIPLGDTMDVFSKKYAFQNGIFRSMVSALVSSNCTSSKINANYIESLQIVFLANKIDVQIGQDAIEISRIKKIDIEIISVC